MPNSITQEMPNYSTQEICSWFSDCISFIQSNCLNCTVFIGMVAVPGILILLSNISDFLNPMDNEAKQEQKLDLTKRIVAKDEPERPHIDIGFTCDISERYRPKRYLFDKNDDSCQRLKQVYPQQTAALQLQIINGTLRHCIRVPNYTVQPEASNTPFAGL